MTQPEPVSQTTSRSITTVYPNEHIKWSASRAEIEDYYKDLKKHGWTPLEELKRKYGLE